MAGKLQQATHELGDACIQLVKDGAVIQGAPDDKTARRDLNRQTKVVSEKVSLLLKNITMQLLPCILYRLLMFCQPFKKELLVLKLVLKLLAPYKD